MRFSRDVVPLFTVSCLFAGGELPSGSVSVNAEHHVSTDSLILVDFSIIVGLILILSVTGSLPFV